MNLLELNNKLKKHFPKEKIVFGGSFIEGGENEYSDFDIYVIFTGFIEFYFKTRNKERLIKIKKDLGGRVSLHFMPLVFLKIGYYYVKGVYFVKDKEKNFLEKGDEEIIKLNRLKLCLKHLILYKIHENDELSDKYYYKLTRYYFFLTGKKEEDVEEIENGIEEEFKKVKTFNFYDWLLYCARFKKILRKDFEKLILDCLMNLKRFVNTNSKDYLVNFYDSYQKLNGKSVKLKGGKERMIELIDKYVFLIFVI